VKVDRLSKPNEAMGEVTNDSMLDGFYNQTAKEASSLQRPPTHLPIRSSHRLIRAAQSSDDSTSNEEDDDAQEEEDEEEDEDVASSSSSNVLLSTSASSMPSRSSTAIGTAARTCSGVSSSSATSGVQGSGADGPSIGGVGNWSLDVAKVKSSCLYSSLDRRVYFFYLLIVC
jgi:hypothetical protein